MKKYFLALLGSLLMISVFAQPPSIEDLPRDVRREARKIEREQDRQTKEDERAGYEITPLPGEYPIPVPRSLYDPHTEYVQSWQTELQRMSELSERIKAECKFPGVVRVSDSGVDQTHRDLRAGFIEEHDWTGEGDQPGNHGTHVAGIVLQFIYPLIETGLWGYIDDKSLRASGSGSFAWPSNMLTVELDDTEQRVANGETVIWNFSWGGGTGVIGSLETAMEKQVKAGAFIVAAAGNSGGPVIYPGNSAWALGISSLDEPLRIASYSCRGPEIDGTAGGSNIYSTIPGNNYAYYSGTSMASPSFASIFVAYARAKWGPELLPDYLALMQYYEKIAVQIGDGDPNKYGFGYPYIEAILDTPPDDYEEPDQPDEPGDEPGEDNPVIGEAKTRFISGPHLMRYRLLSESCWRHIQVPEIELAVAGSGDSQQVHDEAISAIMTYFTASGIGFDVEPDLATVTEWTGTFLNYHFANRTELDASVLKVIGQDEFGRAHIHTEFRTKDAANRSLSSGPVLLGSE